MELQWSDRLNRDFEQSVSRRKALIFAGLAAMGAAGANLSAPIDGSARRRKRKKRPTDDSNTCVPGKVVATLVVPATGQTVTSPVLTLGQRYRVRASGFWSTNGTYGNDAYAAFRFDNPNLPELMYQGVRLGLAVNGGTPDLWSDYSPGHTYEQMITGFGGNATFRFTDPEPADNSGSIAVTIECA